MLGRAIAGRRRERDVHRRGRGPRLLRRRARRPQGRSRASPTPRLRDASEYADYLRMATERSLERCGIDSFDLLLLHNPDRIGYTSEAVWEGMAALREAGLTRLIGVAPGPANGFTLDLIDCLERFGALLDWAMIILNPLEPWPGRAVPRRRGGRRGQGDHARGRLRRPVLRRPAAGSGAGAPGPPRLPARRLDRARPRAARAMRPVAERAGLTMIQLACQWNLAHEPVGVRRADADPGGRRRRPPDRGQARRARRAAGRDAADGRGRRRDPVDRRQHRLHGAQGREPRALRRRAARPLGRSTIISPRWPSAGGSSPSVSSSRSRGSVDEGDLELPADRRLRLRRRPLRGHRAARCPRSTATARAASAAPGPAPPRTRALEPGSFQITSGEDRLRSWAPPDGAEKWFCGDCGSALFSRSRRPPRRRPSRRVRRGPRRPPELRISSSPTRAPWRADSRRRAAALPRAPGRGLSAQLGVAACSARTHSQPTRQVLDAHRGGDVQPHAVAEELVDPLRLGVGAVPRRGRTSRA